MFNHLVTAIVLKRDTNDGLMGFRRKVPIGKTYIVDLTTVHRTKCWNSRKRRFHYKTIVMSVDLDGSNGGGGWLPMECLLIEREGSVH